MGPYERPDPIALSKREIHDLLDAIRVKQKHLKGPLEGTADRRFQALYTKLLNHILPEDQRD
jgi:uncharacterized protein YukE